MTALAIEVTHRPEVSGRSSFIIVVTIVGANHDHCYTYLTMISQAILSIAGIGKLPEFCSLTTY